MRRERSVGLEGWPLCLVAAVRMCPTGRSLPGIERRIRAICKLKEKLGGSDLFLRHEVLVAGLSPAFISLASFCMLQKPGASFSSGFVCSLSIISR